MKIRITLLFMILSALCMPAGCSSQTTLRQIPDAKKKVIMVESFRNDSLDGKKYDPWKLGLSSMIQSDLTAVGYFRVVSPEARRLAFKEIAFSKSGLTEGESLELGRMLKARWILLGDYMVAGNGLSINVKVIEVETSKTLATAKSSGDVDSFFKVSQAVSLDLCRQFQFDLTSEEVAVITKLVDTNSVNASLNNYSGEQILDEIANLELKAKSSSGAEKERLEMKVRELRLIAKDRFKSAVDTDPNYRRAQENLNKMMMMFPSSI